MMMILIRTMLSIISKMMMILIRTSLSIIFKMMMMLIKDHAVHNLSDDVSNKDQAVPNL